MGGILGISCGFSLITAIELFYWFTVRIMADHFSKHVDKVHTSTRNKISPHKSPKKTKDDSPLDDEEVEKELGCHQCKKLEQELKSQIEQLKNELKNELQQQNEKVENLLKGDHI